MKKIVLCLIFYAQVSYGDTLTQASDVTYEWLEGNYETSFIPCMKEVLEKVKPRTLLEFGLGFGTKYFLDSCKRVVSVEVVTHGYGPDRIRNFLQFYRDYSNWIPVAYFSGYLGDMSWAPYKYFGSDAVYVACSYSCATGLSYEEIDPFYLQELDEFISNLVKFNKIETVLIHPILFFRGDMVQLCFNKIPVIVASNTEARNDSSLNDPWGYRKVQTPDNYEEIAIPMYPETTVWVEKKSEFEALIHSLKTL